MFGTKFCTEDMGITALHCVSRELSIYNFQFTVNFQLFNFQLIIDSLFESWLLKIENSAQSVAMRGDSVGEHSNCVEAESRGLVERWEERMLA